MKKGFTLLELLIVVVVISILVSMTFQLVGGVEEDKKRTLTIMRLQKLENAIGGYYAAFGSYPPVPVVGSRNIFCKATHVIGNLGHHGLQQLEEDPVNGELDPIRVEAACRSQMMGAAWPWSKNDKGAEKVRKVLRAGKAHYDAGHDDAAAPVFAYGEVVVLDNIALVDKLAGSESSWSYVQIFRFGLMSFLLPRYLLMMRYDDPRIFDEVLQWTDNNQPPCNFYDGSPYESWSELAKEVHRDENFNFEHPDNACAVALLPSQSITTRWLANFEKSLCFINPLPESVKIYGIDLSGNEGEIDASPYNLKKFAAANAGQFIWMPFYSTDNNQTGNEGEGYKSTYVLDGVTMMDGYNNEFFYYSPAPYQTYKVWSAGENTKTFPPWMSDAEIDAMGDRNARMAREWKSDDIYGTSN